MFSISDEQLGVVKSIVREYVPEVEARVFGSRVSGRDKPYSDLDLALVGRERIPSEVMARLKEAFMESDLPFRVDVVDWNRISKTFQDIIAARYVVLRHAARAK